MIMQQRIPSRFFFCNVYCPSFKQSLGPNPPLCDSNHKGRKWSQSRYDKDTDLEPGPFLFASGILQ